MSKNNKCGKPTSSSAKVSAATAAVTSLAPADEARKQEGMSYCLAKGSEAGWHTLPSGTAFTITRAGRATAEQLSAGPNDTCVVHYRGSFVDGTKFDSSYDRAEPAMFKPSQVVRGWGEILQFMAEGDAWDVVIPWHQAYGAVGAAPAIPGYASLCFTIELKSVRPDPKGTPRLATEARAQLCENIEKSWEEIYRPL